MCGSYCKLVHLTRATPPSLCAESLKSFDEDIRLCFTSCLAVDVPDSHWQQAQLSPGFGGLGFCSLALHSSAAFISSLAFSELCSPDDIHMLQAVTRFNTQVSPQDSITIETILASPPQQKALSKRLYIPVLTILLFSSEQGSNPFHLCSSCRFLDICSPFHWLGPAP